MKRPRTSSLALLFILYMTFTASAFCRPSEASERSESLDSTYERHLASHQGWVLTPEHGPPQLSALSFFTSSPVGIVNRLLLVGDATFPRLVFTNTLNPKNGSATSRIEDEQTGWWLEVIHQGSQPVADLATLMHEGREKPPGTPTPVAMRTEAGVIFESVVYSPGTEAELEPLWAQARTEEGFCANLYSKVPQHVQAVAAALRSLALTFDGLVYWRLEIGILDTCLRDQEPADQARKLQWQIEEGQFHIGLAITDPELLELTSKFQSVDNVEPLSYREIAELLGVPEEAVR